ncbi:activator of 90 kDa heat shock protein ATPase-like protein 1 [Lophium mytilinum]|uniref:Activator of 90 kDa heat shock protein ATPase-like protein 1 n=1 Tax=Lophium mytilinum TaxID=390894 RepID=A0A6A6QM20_9PEZI|nr:activator of 90 kDa heat shock protein ATPase-like protein 1 [Lophium mytilinum]
MVLHNPNNWHWVNKDVSPWAKEFLEKELTDLSAEDGGVSAKVDKVVSMDGDVDVSQRKGKVITLFDVKLKLEYSGKNKDGEEASGTITIPEVAHDTEEDEYVFDIDIYSDASSKQPVKDLVRAKIVPQLREHLQKLGPALIAEHGRDIQHAPGDDPSTGWASPKVYSSSSVNKTASEPKSTSTTTTQGGSSGPHVNVTTLEESTEFRTTAAELYKTFTDPARMAAFTRSPPSVFTGAVLGGRYELFGGNVSGEYTVLEEPTHIVQKWRLAQWPQGHYSTLSIHFDQNDVDSVTVMRVEWKGVPIGQEEPTKRNWGEYYVRSIKTTFGFGTVL